MWGKENPFLPPPYPANVRCATFWTPSRRTAFRGSSCPSLAGCTLAGGPPRFLQSKNIDGGLEFATEATQLHPKDAASLGIPDGSLRPQ